MLQWTWQAVLCKQTSRSRRAGRMPELLQGRQAIDQSHSALCRQLQSSAHQMSCRPSTHCARLGVAPAASAQLAAGSTLPPAPASSWPALAPALSTARTTASSSSLRPSVPPTLRSAQGLAGVWGELEKGGVAHRQVCRQRSWCSVRSKCCAVSSSAKFGTSGAGWKASAGLKGLPAGAGG